MKQQIHLISQPHTQVTKEYSACAYTSKVRKLADMLVSLGYTVFLYAGEGNDTKAELITCLTKKQLLKFGFGGPEDYLKIKFDANEEIWKAFHKKIITEMSKRIKPKDLILTFSGLTDAPVAGVFKDNMLVEAGIGYTGVVPGSFKVFESHAWQHYIQGRIDGANATDADIHYYDTVIPNYFDVSEFPFSDTKEDYFLYIGRLIERKGWRVAQEVCKKLGKRLIVAGHGDFSGYGEYVGMVGPEERGKLMSKAQAVFVPTQYLGPFEGVHVEAMLCGTPVITSPVGVFTETVENNVNGLRCGMFREYLEAANLAMDHEFWDYDEIRQDAIAKYSTDVVKYQYQEYFNKLLTLSGNGWYAD